MARFRRMLSKIGSVLMVCSASVLLIALTVATVFPSKAFSKEPGAALLAQDIKTVSSSEDVWANRTAVGAIIFYTIGLTFKVLPKMNESRDLNDKAHREEVKELMQSKDTNEKAHREEIASIVKSHREDIAVMMRDWSATISKSTETLSDLKKSCAAANAVARIESGR